MSVRGTTGSDGTTVWQVSNDEGWETVPYGVDPYAYDAMDREQRIQQQALAEAKFTRDSNRGYIDFWANSSMGGQQYATDNLNKDYDAIQRSMAQGLAYTAGQGNQALATQKAAAGTAGAGDAAIIDALRAYYGGATALDQQAVSGLQGAQGLSDAEQLGMFQNMLGQTDFYNTADQRNSDWLIAQYKNSLADRQNAAAYGPDLASAAGGASADPYAINAQRSALGQLGGIAGGAGSLSSQQAGVYTDPALLEQLFGAAGSYQDAAGGGMALQSQLAGVSSDPNDVARQLQAMQGYSGVAAGDRDLTSAMAGAYADPNAIAMQQQAGQRLYDIASGGANLQSTASGVQADPEAVAAQRAFLRKYAQDSNPEMTATERYMMEQARRTEEQERRAAMDAKLRDLQARGMLGSGEEIAAMLGAQQTTSQNRMLQDMAAQAQAQARAERSQQAGTALAGDIRGSSFGEGLDRASAVDEFGLANRDAAMNALAQYTGLANTTRGASFAETAARANAADTTAEGNRAVQLQGLDQYAQLAAQFRQMGLSEQQAAAAAADAMAQSNRSTQLGSMDQYSALLEQLRTAGFDEATARAMAADQMEQSNRAYQMQGLQQYLSGAGDVRNQSYGEAYQTGAASDAMAEFNRTNSLQQANYNTELQRQQTEAAYANALGTANFGMATTAQDYDRLQDMLASGNQIAGDQFARAGTVYGAQTGMTDAAYSRANDLAQTGLGTNQTAYDRATQTATAQANLGQQNFQNLGTVSNYAQAGADAAYGAEQDRQNAAMQYSSLWTNQGLAGQGAIADAQKQQLGYYANKDAQQALEDDQFNLLNPGTWF